MTLISVSWSSALTSVQVRTDSSVLARYMGIMGILLLFSQSSAVLSHTHGVAAIKILLIMPPLDRDSPERKLCGIFTPLAIQECLTDSKVRQKGGGAPSLPCCSVKFLTVIYRHGYKS